MSGYINADLLDDFLRSIGRDSGNIKIMAMLHILRAGVNTLATDDVVSKELYEQMRFERDLNQRLYEALLKDVNDYQGVICNYCLKDQTDKCISPDEAVLACGQFEWRGFNHENTEKKREKYGEIRLKDNTGKE